MVSLDENLNKNGFFVISSFPKDDPFSVGAGLGRVAVEFAIEFAIERKDFHILLASEAMKGHTEYPDFIPLVDCYLVYSEKGRVCSVGILNSTDGRIYQFKSDLEE